MCTNRRPPCGHTRHIRHIRQLANQSSDHQQKYQQLKPQQQNYCQYFGNKMLSFQFRIVSMPQRLRMRLLPPPSAHTFLTYCNCLLVVLAALTVMPPVCQAVGYSYSRFSGPVTGPEQKIIIHDELVGGGGGGVPSVDYIARPAYEFAYGVEDAQARLLQNRQETRDGDQVRGSYSVVEPDGNLRVVKYTSDHKNGFQAEVTRNGVNTELHGHNTPPTPYHYFPKHTVQHQIQRPRPTKSAEKYNNKEYDNDDYNDADQGDEDGGHDGRGNYEVTEDYEENESNGERDKEQSKNQEAEDNESGENNAGDDDDDEPEDYDGGNEQSAEVSEQTNSDEEYSEEY